jgi:hypothetical protein
VPTNPVFVCMELAGIDLGATTGDVEAGVVAARECKGWFSSSVTLLLMRFSSFDAVDSGVIGNDVFQMGADAAQCG